MAKNIVLLSDGTGNSSAKLLKTNVWRVYEALDLSDPSKQVACSDDGVGPSSFKPLALIGGALGIGLKRNVLRLYRFLCEHYDPGDQIFAFGFSRGAYTIRVLVGLVCSQGIVKTRPTSPLAEAYPRRDPEAAAQAAYRFGDTIVRSEARVFGVELARLCRWAYRDFRRSFNQTGVLVDVTRNLRDVLIRHLLERGRSPYTRSLNHDVEAIRLGGVWDTVDAYGLPIDELTNGINHPRRIEWLTNGQIDEASFFRRSKSSPTVTVARPNIHQSALARIAAAPETSALIIFPERGAVVREDGTIIDGNDNPYEQCGDAARRAQAQPFGATPAEVVTVPERTFVSRLLALADQAIGWIPDRWVAYSPARQAIVAGYAIGLLLLTRISARLQAAICNGMRGIGPGFGWRSFTTPTTTAQ